MLVTFQYQNFPTIDARFRFRFDIVDIAPLNTFGTLKILGGAENFSVKSRFFTIKFL